MKKTIGYIILFALASCAVVFAFSGCAGVEGSKQLETAKIQAIDAVDVDSLPSVEFGKGGVTVLDAGATANLLHQYAVEDDAEDALVLDTIVKLNDRENETIEKTVRNMAWAGASPIMAVAIIALSILGVVALMKKGGAK
jgi:hypothetical protein